jgi:hypothetical protein
MRRTALRAALRSAGERRGLHRVVRRRKGRGIGGQVSLVGSYETCGGTLFRCGHWYPSRRCAWRIGLGGPKKEKPAFVE